MSDRKGLIGPRGIPRKVFDNIADGVLVADLEQRRFCSCNPMICRMTGYSQDEMLRLGVSDIHPPEDLPHVVDQFRRQCKQEFSLAKDIPVKRKDGRVFYADVNSVPMTLEGKDYLVGIFRDATERRNEEKGLREKEEHLRLLVDALPDLMFRLDPDGRFLAYKAERISELLLPPDHFIGKYYYEVLPPDISQQLSAAIETARESGKLQIMEYRMTPPGMEEQFYEARVVATKREHCVIVCRIITERKRNEEELKQAASQLRAQGKALEQKNVALKEVLAQIEVEKLQMERQITANASKFILPILHKLKFATGQESRRYLELLESGIKKLTSQFGARLGINATSLSPRETEICNMIRNGLSTKEMAQMLHVSSRTVDTFRNRIRKKLGISSKNVNLFVYLQKMS